jgi:hypothetical protein
MRRLAIVLVAVFIGTLGIGADAFIGQRDALMKLLTPPMMAVAKLIAHETWDPRFDEYVQQFPAAAPLGNKWSKSAPAWQKARAVMAARLTRILDLYASHTELTEELQAGLDKLFPGAQAEALHRVLTGPDGPTIMRWEAEGAVLLGGPPRPDAPQPGDPAWNAYVGARIKRARAVLDTLFSPYDPKRQPAAAKFNDEPLGRQFADLWRTVQSRAENTIDGAMNLLMFDDGPAIVREITQAIATVK